MAGSHAILLKLARRYIRVYLSSKRIKRNLFHRALIQIFTIANEIRDEKEMNGVIATSIGSAVSLYLLVAFTGYISYGSFFCLLPAHLISGSNVSGNIISMYKSSAAATFGRAAI